MLTEEQFKEILTNPEQMKALASDLRNEANRLDAKAANVNTAAINENKCILSTCIFSVSF
jgi:hypothetical protein